MFKSLKEKYSQLQSRMAAGVKGFFQYPVFTIPVNFVKKIFSGIKKARQWIDRGILALLDGTHQHYSCYLPQKTGFFSGWLFKRVFSRIRIAEERSRMLKDLPENAVIVYANRYKSYFEYLFYHSRYRDNGMPCPEIGFDHRFIFLQPLSRLFKIFLAHTDYLFRNWDFLDPYYSGYIRQELENDRAALVSLVEKGGFYLRFIKSHPDPIRYLIEMQRELDRPICVIPQLMFFSKKPTKSVPSLADMLFGPEDRPGLVRRLFTLFKNPNAVFVEVSDPLNLQTFLDAEIPKTPEIEKLALTLRQRLIKQMDRHRQSITGPMLKPVEEIKESILTNERLRGFMESHAEARELPIQKVRKEADRYLDEIAARYSPNMIRIFSGVVSWMVRLMFEGVSFNREILGQIRNASRKGELIYVPCHKSHIDYLILSYVLYHHDQPCPHIAAGKNLSFWPLGPIFRSGGAFFIRRTFRGAVLYSKVFAEYVHKLMAEGFNIEFFIEGGRSRTGKLLRPKLGLLSILLNAYKAGACEDMLFVPVFVGYDRVPEESAYLHELEGGQKNPESLWQVIKARKFLKKRYGRIYIRFHEPISANRLLEQKGTSIHQMDSKEQNVFCRNLGYRLLNAINQVTVVTPHAVMAGAILNGPRHRFSYEDLLEYISTYMNYLMLVKAPLADTLLLDQTSALEYAFDAYVQRKFVERVSAEELPATAEPQYIVNLARRPALEYYKNNCAAWMIPAAFTALAILEKDAFQFSTADLADSYGFFREFFKNEFAYDADKSPEHMIQENIRYFVEDAILMPHPSLPDTYNLTSAGLRKLQLFSAYLRTYLESYWIVLSFFLRQPKKSSENAKERIKKIQSLGNRMYRRKEIERPEALSRINYTNAVDFFTNHGIKGAEDTEAIEYYAQAIRRYLSLLSA